MSKLFKILSAVGLAEEVQQENQEAAPQIVKTASVKVETVAQVVAPQVSSIDAAKLAALDKSIHDQLSQALESANASTVEELGDLLETLSAAIPDEQLRYKTAIDILVKKGHTVDNIIADIDKCIGVLEDKSRVFTSEMKQQLDKRVGSKVTAVETLAATIQQKEDQVELLRKEIVELSVKKNAEQSGISEEQSKIAQTQDRFNSVFKKVRSEVELQKTKISQYGVVS